MEEKPSEIWRQVTELLGRRKIREKRWDESKKTLSLHPSQLFRVAQNVIEGYVYGVMNNSKSQISHYDLESYLLDVAFRYTMFTTFILESQLVFYFCGQAVGAGQPNMLGIYLQRSWIITGVTAFFLTPVYVFASPLLKLLHQNKNISELAGKYLIWVIPQFFAYALNFPIQKFLQSQSKVWVLTMISIVVPSAFDVLLNWVLVIKLRHGLHAAAITGTGFSLLAFRSLTGFVKLSLASAIMLWLVVGL